MNRFASVVQALRQGATGALLVATIAAVAAVLLTSLPVGAQTVPVKTPPRDSPNTSETTRIPAGVDTGSPTTGGAMQLGTPVPPAASSDRSDSRTRSAAARMAARPDPLTRTGAPSAPAPIVTDDVRRDASRPPAAGSAIRTGAAATDCAMPGDSQFRVAMSRCSSMSDRDARASCASRAVDARRTGGEPVALPQTGFLGSSASPRAAAGVARGAARNNCP